MAEKPLLPCFVPQRSTACSRFSAATTPSSTGTPVAIEISLNAFAVAWLMRSACAVAPCTTAPRHTTASNFFAVSVAAAIGSSYAPGTRTSVRSFSAPPMRRNASSAPFTSCSVRKLLKRLTTIATLSPVADNSPVISFMSKILPILRKDGGNFITYGAFCQSGAGASKSDAAGTELTARAPRRRRCARRRQ